MSTTDSLFVQTARRVRGSEAHPGGRRGHGARVRGADARGDGRVASADSQGAKGDPTRRVVLFSRIAAEAARFLGLPNSSFREKAQPFRRAGRHLSLSSWGVGVQRFLKVWAVP